MSDSADMHPHFTEISPVYRSVRTTDPELVERMAESSIAWPGRGAPTSGVAWDAMSS